MLPRTELKSKSVLQKLKERYERMFAETSESNNLWRRYHGRSSGVSFSKTRMGTPYSGAGTREVNKLYHSLLMLYLGYATSLVLITRNNSEPTKLDSF